MAGVFVLFDSLYYGSLTGDQILRIFQDPNTKASSMVFIVDSFGPFELSFTAFELNDEKLLIKKKFLI